MKVALCLHGLVGSASKKSGDSINLVPGRKKKKRDKKMRELVLGLAHLHWDKYILSPNDVDVFAHSWSTDLSNCIINKFNPLDYCFEPQKIFDIPLFIYQKYNIPLVIEQKYNWNGTISKRERYADNIEIRNNKLRRIKNHYSKWYSFRKSIDLALDYERNNDVKYDCIIGARFDLAIKKEVIFDEYNMNYFWKVGGPPWDNSKKLQDHLFFSNKDKMRKFRKVYDNIDYYLQENRFSEVQISNHRLAKRHLIETFVGMDSIPDFLKKHPIASPEDLSRYIKMRKKRTHAVARSFKDDDGPLKNVFYEHKKDDVNETECPLVRALYFDYTRRGPNTYSKKYGSRPIEGRLASADDLLKKYF